MADNTQAKPIVFYVEDDESNRETTIDYLGLKGYEVIAASDEPEAIGLIPSLGAGVIAAVLDVDLSKGPNGGHIRGVIREMIRANLDLPIIFVSNKDITEQTKDFIREALTEEEVQIFNGMRIIDLGKNNILDGLPGILESLRQVLTLRIWLRKLILKQFGRSIGNACKTSSIC
jgi:CheY-like chemotaxis protein